MAVERESGGEIEVKVRVYAGLRRHLPALAIGQSITVRLPANATVGEALEQLGIPRAETKSCFVNGIQREFSYRLSHGDDLAAFPPIAGGSVGPPGATPPL